MIEGIVLGVLERVLSAYIASVLTKGSGRRRREELLAVVNRYFETLTEVSDEVAALRLAMQELDLLVRDHPMLHWAGDELVVGGAVGQKASESIGSAQEALAILHREVDRRRAETSVVAGSSTGTELVPARRPDAGLRDGELATVDQSAASGVPAPTESDVESWTAEVNRLHGEVRRERRRRSS